MATATQSYASEFQDRMFAISWKAGSANGLDPSDPNAAGLTNPTTDMIAGVFQITYLIRYRGDRLASQIIPPGAWIPHVLYTHVVLQDYLAARLPEKMVVCPEDVWRNRWQNWQDYDAGAFLPMQPTPGGVNWRWPYSSSYQVPPCTYDNSPVGARIQQVGNPTNTYTSFGTATKLGGRKLADVSSPSSKVLIMEDFDRHNDRPDKHLYYGMDNARVSIGMFDGSVQMRRTSDGNEGWKPNQPTDPGPTLMSYSNVGRPWDPPAQTGAADIVKGYYRWTRGGLRGNDFGGGEVRTNAN
jgi:hypothetical protein